MATVKLDIPTKPKGKPRGNPDKTAPYRFKKGQSGNPSGRPKGSGSSKISGAYEAALCQQVPESVLVKLGISIEGKCTWADVIGLQLVRKAVDATDAKVSFKAITELRESTEGKTPDKIEATGKDGAPLTAGPTFTLPINFVDPPEHKS